MKFFLFYLLTFLCLIEHINAQEINWLKREGGASYERSQSIIVDEDNFIYVTGGYNGNSQIGQQTLPAYGDEDIFISKHDQNGNLEWVVTAGGTEQDLPFSINLDSESNVYVTGFMNEPCTFGDTTLTGMNNDQIFLAKYNNEGVFQWVRQAGSHNQNWGKSVIVDSDDNIIITGNIGADASFQDTIIVGSNTLFIAKYNNNGDLLYAKSGDGHAGLNSICSDESNNLFATGQYHGELILDDISTNSNSIYSFIVASFSPLGQTQWIYNGGGLASGNGTSIIVDNNNDLCFTYLFYDSTVFEGNQYYSNGNYDLILGKISNSGSLIWQKHIGGSNLWHDKTITIDSYNNIYLTGTLRDTDYFEGIPITSQDDDVFVAKFNSDGGFCWLIQGSGIDQDQGAGICLNESGSKIFSIGTFNYTFDFDGHTVTTNGSSDFFLSEISLVSNVNEPTSDNAFVLYPNPTSGIAKCSIGNIKSVLVINELGEIILNKYDSNEIDLSNMPTGIYFIRINTPTLTVVEKLVKQ